MKHFELILAAALCGSVCAGTALNAADAKAAKEEKKAEKKAESAWLTDLAAAKKQAAEEKKPILMFFTGSDWCGWCRKLHEDVLDKDEFQKFAKDSVILLELDFPNSIPQSDALKKQNKALGEKFKVNGYPTMVLVASDGEKEITRTVGYDKELVSKLQKAVKKAAASGSTANTTAKNSPPSSVLKSHMMRVTADAAISRTVSHTKILLLRAE